MRTKIFTLLLINAYLSCYNIKAQEITCDAFCITGVYMDTTTANLMYASLYFSEGINDFINYPWISEVINEQGDTVGVGAWNFFGQFGNTTTDYPITVNFDEIPANFNATMIFHYDTSVCLLSFPCTTSIEDENNNYGIQIYPNPFSEEAALHAEISFHHLIINIFDMHGQLFRKIENQNSSDILITRDGLSDGIYFVQLREGSRILAMKKMVLLR